MAAQATNGEHWTLVRGARQLLTLHQHTGPRRAGELSNLGAIPDGSVLLHNGLIEAVGPTRRVENVAQARRAEEISAAGRLVMPAFVDANACLVPPPSWGSIPARTIESLPATRLEAQADDLLKIMARHGTGTVGGISGQALDSSGELKILRAMRACNQQPLDVISILAVTKPVSAEGELLRCAKDRKLTSVAQARCGDGGLSLEDAAAFLALARTMGFAVRFEMTPQHDPGLVDAAVTLDAIAIFAAMPFTLSEIECLTASSIFAIVAPAGVSPHEPPCFARQLVDAGCLVALGSGLAPDGIATASMQTAIQLACRRFGLTIEEAISAATCNAAWALGVGALTGTLEHGKRADLILLDISDYREIPLFTGANLVHTMIKRGVVVCKEDFPGWPAHR